MYMLSKQYPEVMINLEKGNMWILEILFFEEQWWDNYAWEHMADVVGACPVHKRYCNLYLY